MTIQIFPATPDDASSIASLFLSAFDPNPLLHVQFPTPVSRESLQKFIVQETLRDLDDSGRAVVVARYTGRVVGFASWALPGAGEREGREWPTEWRKEWLEEYYRKAGEARRRVIGEMEGYVRSFDIFQICADECRAVIPWY
jgi:hypothetical protein